MRLGAGLIALCCFVFSAAASEYPVANDNQPRCNGMYSKSAWGGNIDPFILTKLANSSADTPGDPVVTYVVYEFRDEELLGIPTGKGSDSFFYTCDAEARAAGVCKDEEANQFLLAPNATDLAKSPIITRVIHLKDAAPVNYPIKKTGYYCVWIINLNSNLQLEGGMVFQNAYGQLPAAQIAKLPFYGGLTIAYMLIGAFWAFLYFQNRHDILAVQNYITAILVFLIVEEITTWGFYDSQNRHGSANIGSKALLVVTAVLNAARNSFSFFLLLIVCMGYGVVKPSLGKTMVYVRILALAHFVFGLIYGVGSLSITPDTVGPIVLLVIMPLAATLTFFYVWTLNSLSTTLRDLLKRKQTVKALMYKRLWWCILGSILVIFAFFFFNSFTFASRSDPDFVPNHWKTRWFILDGWLNLVYLFDICFIAYLWRPTANNRRFAMSDELAQDEDGNFEIASLGGISDDEDEEEGRARGANQANGASRRPVDPAVDSDDEDPPSPISPVPPMPVREGRHSLEDDGETLFAVGEDDIDKDWSDDEGGGRDSQEKSRLTSHKD